VDHSFKVKGKGHVLTGTILDGFLNKNDTISPLNNPSLSYKVKSIQSFRQDIERGVGGDRVGLLIQGESLEWVKGKERQMFVNRGCHVESIKHILCLVSRVP